MSEDNTKTSDQVARIVERLQREIISGELEAGGPLKQESVAAKYGVSRMPVREAFKQLEMLGYVSVDHNRRTRVAPMSLADFLEIYDMRISAEALAIQSSLPHLTNVQIDAAAKVQDEIENSAPEQFGPLNFKFHTTLYQPSGRSRLLGHIRNLGDAADRYVFMCSVDQEFREKSNQEHRELIEACFARNEAGAVRCVSTHISDARDKFAAMLVDTS